MSELLSAIIPESRLISNFYALQIHKVVKPDFSQAQKKMWEIREGGGGRAEYIAH